MSRPYRIARRLDTLLRFAYVGEYLVRERPPGFNTDITREIDGDEVRFASTLTFEDGLAIAERLIEEDER